MAISMYDNLSYAQPFQARSLQEMLQPAMMMREQHDKIDEQYATLNDELQKASFIADSIQDEKIKGRYNNYMNDLTKARDELYQNGINNSSMRQMHNLRGRFNSEITPMVGAYELYRNDIKSYDDMRMKDSTWRGTNPRNNSLDSYINNGLLPQQINGYSGSMLGKQVSEMASSMRERILNDAEYRKLFEDRFGSQYMQRMISKGLSPDELMSNPEIQNMIEQAMESSGAKSWADEQTYNELKSFAQQGAYSAIGAQAYDKVDDKMWGHNANLEMEGLRAARASAAKSSKEGADKSQDLIVGTYQNQDKDNDILKKEYDYIKDNPDEIVKRVFNNKDLTPETYKEKTMKLVNEGKAQGASSIIDPLGNVIDIRSKTTNISLRSLSGTSWNSDVTPDYESKINNIASNIKDNNKYSKMISDYKHIFDGDEKEALLFANSLEYNKKVTGDINIGTRLNMSETLNYLNNASSRLGDNVMLYELEGNSSSEYKTKGEIKAKDAKELFNKERNNKNSGASIIMNPKYGLIFIDTEGKHYEMRGITDQTNALSSNLKGANEFLYSWDKKSFDKNSSILYDSSILNNEDSVNRLLQEKGFDLGNKNKKDVVGLNVQIPYMKNGKQTFMNYKIVGYVNGNNPDGTKRYSTKTINQYDMINKGEEAGALFANIAMTNIPSLKHIFENKVSDTNKEFNIDN